MSYNHFYLCVLSVILAQIVCKSLGCSPHCVYIHTVGAHSHNATQATCAKLQILVEALNKFCGIICIKHLLNLFLGFSIIIATKPHLRFRANIFN